MFSELSNYLVANSQMIHPVVYEAIDACSIRRASLQTFGAAGPSESDAACWRRMRTTFKKSSVDLCDALAHVAKKLCSSLVDSRCISPLLVCYLIALSKDPGVRPIGICEVAQRIIAKAVFFIFKLNILEGGGHLQLCAGHVGRVEATIHLVRSAFDDDAVEGVVIVDAANVFNSLNHSVALLNIQQLHVSDIGVLCD